MTVSLIRQYLRQRTDRNYLIALTSSLYQRFGNDTIHHICTQYHHQHPHRRGFSSSSIMKNRTNTNNTNTTGSHEVYVVRHGETEWNRKSHIQGGGKITHAVGLNETGRKQASKTAEEIFQQIQTKLLLLGSGCTVRIYTSQLQRAYETATIISNRIAQSVLVTTTKKETTTTTTAATTIPSSTSSTALSILDTIQQHPALNEWNLDQLEGLTVDDAQKKYPACWNVLKEWCNPYVSNTTAFTKIQSNGESMEQVRLRSVNFIESIVSTSPSSSSFSPNDNRNKNSRHSDNNNDVIIIVTHGALIGQLLRHTVSVQYKEWEGSYYGGHDRQRQQQQQENLKKEYPRPKNGSITTLGIDTSKKSWTIQSWAASDHLS